MALFPLSIFLEILIPILALIMSDRGEFGRFIGVCLWPIEITLVVLPLAFISDASGTLAVSTITFPANILGIFVLVIFLFWLWSLVDLWYFRLGIKEPEL